MADKRAWFFNTLEALQDGFSEAIAGTATLIRAVVSASPSVQTIIFLAVITGCFLAAFASVVMLIHNGLKQQKRSIRKFSQIEPLTDENGEFVWLHRSDCKAFKRKKYLVHFIVDGKVSDSVPVTIIPKLKGIQKNQALISPEIYAEYVSQAKEQPNAELVIEKELVDFNELFIRKAVLAAFAMALFGGVIDAVINEYYYQKSIYDQAASR